MDSELLCTGMTFASQSQEIWMILSVNFDENFFIFLDEGRIRTLRNILANEMFVSFWTHQGVNRLL